MPARKKTKTENEYYSLEKITKRGKQIKAKYYIIFGQRSSGKTYAVLNRILENYCKKHKQGAILRRYREDFIGKRGQVMFSSLVNNDLVSKYTNDSYNGVKYYGKQWFLCKTDETGEIVKVDEKPFCYGFALSEMEHDKSTSYPNITTICFDEFISRNGYINDEFILFMNTLSTIIRSRNDVEVFMLGNTINKYCPYFAEMGLKHIKDMQQGSIDIYTYGNKDLKVLVEYTSETSNNAKSTSYFAFDNPKLEMITTGAWELDIYPHCPCKFTVNDVLKRFFIIWDSEIFEGDIVVNDDREIFIFFHAKTTPIKDVDSDIVFTQDYSIKRNYFRNIMKRYNPLSDTIKKLFISDRVFYQNNEIGDAINNYLRWCKGN